MSYQAGAYQRDYQLSNRFYVDLGTACPASIQDGSIARPFGTIPQGVAAAQAAQLLNPALTQWYFELASGVYPEAISLPPNFDFTFVGTIRRGAMSITGPITWTVANPALTSRLGFRNVIVAASITVVDGASPAAPAVLTLEGCQLGASAGGSVVQTTGASVLTIVPAGMSTSGFATTTSPVVQSVLAARLLLPGSNLWLSGTQCRPVCDLIRVGTLRAVGSSFEQPIEITSASDPHAEFLACSFPTPGLTVTFSTPGVASLDDYSAYLLAQSGWSLVNGSARGGAVFHPSTLGFAARFDGLVRMANALEATNTISPSALSSDTHNWNPTGLASATRIRMSASSALSLTGLAGGTDGRVIALHNIGTADIDLMHEHASSSAVNRFVCPSNAELPLRRNAGVLLMYDGASGRWRPLSTGI